jgi:hypothetical protein
MLRSLAMLAIRPAHAAARVAGEAGLAALDALLVSRFADEAIRRVLASALAERTVEQIDPLASAVMERLLENEQLWVVVDEIASSDAVTEAITHQSVGFADQVAGELRVRVRHADTRLEHAARRVLRRAPPP